MCWVLQFLSTTTILGARLTRKYLVSQVKAFIRNHGIVDDWVPGKKWISGFIRRHETFWQCAAKGKGRPPKQVSTTPDNKIIAIFWKSLYFNQDLSWPKKNLYTQIIILNSKRNDMQFVQYHWHAKQNDIFLTSVWLANGITPHSDYIYAEITTPDQFK